MSAAAEAADRYVVISADTHAGADVYDYKPYLPARPHDEFDAWARSYVSPFDDLVIATAQRNWDHEFRLSEMDADGVAGEILFPNTIPPFFPTSPNITISLPRTREEFERRFAGVQAHNRWQVDFCSLLPARRRGLMECETLDEVGRALDRVLAGGYHLSSTLGRHTNDKMVSFYVRTPGGWDLEVGCEGMLVDETSYTAEEITADSYWGHKWDWG